MEYICTPAWGLDYIIQLLFRQCYIDRLQVNTSELFQTLSLLVWKEKHLA